MELQVTGGRALDPDPASCSPHAARSMHPRRTARRCPARGPAVLAPAPPAGWERAARIGRQGGYDNDDMVDQEMCVSGATMIALLANGSAISVVRVGVITAAVARRDARQTAAAHTNYPRLRHPLHGARHAIVNL